MIESLHGHKGAVVDFIFPTNDTVVSAGRDGLVCIWDINQSRCSGKISAHNDGTTCIASMNSNQTPLIASGGMDGYLGLWDSRQCKAVFLENLTSPGAAVTLVDYADEKIIGIGADNSVSVIDIRCMSRFGWKESDTNYIYSIKIFGQTVLLGTGNGRVIERSFDDGRLLRETQVDTNAVRCIESMGPSSIVMATDDGNLVYLYQSCLRPLQ